MDDLKSVFSTPWRSDDISQTLWRDVLCKLRCASETCLHRRCTLSGTGAGVLVGAGVGTVVAAPVMLCVGVAAGIGTATGYTIGKKLKKRWKDRISAYGPDAEERRDHV